MEKRLVTLAPAAVEITEPGMLERACKSDDASLLHSVRHLLQPLDHCVADQLARDDTLPVEPEVLTRDLEIQAVTVGFPEYPVNLVKPVPQLSRHEVGDQKNRDR